MERNLLAESHLLNLAEALGWDIQKDNLGQIIIYTGLQHTYHSPTEESPLGIEEFGAEFPDEEDF